MLSFSLIDPKRINVKITDSKRVIQGQGYTRSFRGIKCPIEFYKVKIEIRCNKRLYKILYRVIKSNTESNSVIQGTSEVYIYI